MRGALNDKAELLVQVDGGGVVRIDDELDAAQPEPSVGELQHGGHERAANTLAVKVVVDGHAEARDAVAAGIALEVQTELPDNPPVDHGDQAVGVGVSLRKPLAPKLDSSDKGSCSVFENASGR